MTTQEIQFKAHLFRLTIRDLNEKIGKFRDELVLGTAPVGIRRAQMEFLDSVGSHLNQAAHGMHVVWTLSGDGTKDGGAK